MAQSKRTPLSDDQVHLILKALGDRRRYAILQRLKDSEHALACEKVRGCLAIAPATLSHHMKELETAGLVRVVRQSKFASYILRQDVLAAFFDRLKADLS